MSDLRPDSELRFRTLAGICALTMAFAPALAEDDGQIAVEFSTARKTLRPGQTRTAYVPIQANRFANSVNMQMEALAALSETSQPGRQIHDNVMYDVHAEAVERSLVRTTRRAFKDYLLEVTAVDRMIERYKNKGMRSVGLDKIGSTRASGRNRGTFGLDFGISSFRPAVGLEYETGRNSFKLSVDGNGHAGFRYRNPRWGGNQVSVGFDGEDVYYLSWHVGGY